MKRINELKQTLLNYNSIQPLVFFHFNFETFYIIKIRFFLSKNHRYLYF